MFDLKPLAIEAVPSALAKAERYRLLNEPAQAESICLDILAAEANHQQAIVTLVLTQTDQFDKDPRRFHDALETVARLDDAYQRDYFTGMVWERRARARFDQGGYGSNAIVYEWYLEAMRWYEKSEQIRPAGNDDALLRWNTCARFLNGHPDARQLLTAETYEPQLLE